MTIDDYAIHNDISIFIHLPDGYLVRDDRYRERLLYKTGSEPLKCEDFMDEVRSNRPQWVIDLVEALGQNRKSSVGFGMSGVGGRADIDFGWLDVCL